MGNPRLFYQTNRRIICKREQLLLARKEHRKSNHLNKLDVDKVKSIRIKLQNGGVPTHIAREFNVSSTLIYHIRDNKTWTDPEYYPEGT